MTLIFKLIREPEGRLQQLIDKMIQKLVDKILERYNPFETFECRVWFFPYPWIMWYRTSCILEWSRSRMLKKYGSTPNGGSSWINSYRQIYQTLVALGMEIILIRKIWSSINLDAKKSLWQIRKSRQVNPGSVGRKKQKMATSGNRNALEYIEYSRVQ